MVNERWSAVLGWAAEELVSRAWSDLVHPDDQKLAALAGDELRSGRSLQEFTSRFRAKDGTYRWLEWRAAAVPEKDVVYAVVSDVTEATATKASLRELSENLSTTLNSIGDGVIATDLRGEVTRMNPVAERLTGWTLAEAAKRPLSQVLPLVNGETRDIVESPADHALREGTAVSLAKRTLLARRDGSEILIADSCAPIRGNDDAINGAVLVFRDLTVQEKAEAAQAAFREQLVSADRLAAVGTLAAGVAHEINNPLTFLAANLDMATELVCAINKASSSDPMRDLEVMLREAQGGAARVTKIVRGLKTFSRVEKETIEVTDLIPVLELAINMTLNEIRHRARLIKDYGKVPLVDVDGPRLGQVFINLLVNAAQSFGDGNAVANEIRVVTSTDLAGRAVVEIRDSGQGIPPEILNRIFDPFFTTKGIGDGTGLGLAISRNIVAAMGGEILVQSRLGRGASFRVILPPSTSVELPPVTANAEPEPHSPRCASVLVVDDEASVGLAIRRVLGTHDVTTVTSARDALRVLAAGKDFDVVLSDLMMPGMSGMDLYRELLRLYPHLARKVVFLTGGAFTADASSFLDRVDNERVEKPFDSQKLRELVVKYAQ
jgi:PAS domain S-box-containing protein